jgi:PAS domain S-box-containing protein
MKQGNNHYQKLLENVSDAVYTVDMETKRFSSVNNAALKLTGYKKKELLSMQFGEIIPPEYRELVQKKIAQKIKRNVPTIYELEILRKDGLRIPIEVSSRLIVKEGKPAEILGIARNIADRKKAEQEKEVFISLLTHEIKNPLTAVNMHLSVLQKLAKGKEHHPMHASLAAIKQQIQSITYLMNDFLEVNKLALGKFSITKEQYSFDQQVDGQISLFQNQTHEIVRQGDKNIIVYADKNRIAQVLYNLISNAIKYSPDAKKVYVSVKKEGKQVVFSVKDQGVGIPKDEQKNIFQLFYRTRHSRQSNIKGHGLGLFIAQQIIQSHKQTIWIESAEGKGAEFYFTLPLK